MTELPKITKTHRVVPKSQHSIDEYEDACSYRIVDSAGFFAIADGATESAFPKRWAELLTHSFVRHPKRVFHGQWNEWLVPLQNQWYNYMHDKELPWYARAKVQQGAYAAFLGLVIAGNRNWQAVAIGDCCLFHVRDDQLITAFPMESSTQFNTSPKLIGSSTVPDDSSFQHLAKVCRGKWNLNDKFILVTDALANYFLRLYEQGQSPSDVINSWILLSDEEFRDQIDTLRHEFAHDDDITLLVIELPEDSLD